MIPSELLAVLWENHSNFNIDTDILISFGGKRHKNSASCQREDCNYNFDGKGGILAHAFLPNNDKCVEIRLDKSEDWYFNYDTASNGKTSFFNVILHEIERTSGLPLFNEPQRFL